MCSVKRFGGQDIDDFCFLLFPIGRVGGEPSLAASDPSISACEWKDFETNKHNKNPSLLVVIPLLQPAVVGG